MSRTFRLGILAVFCAGCLARHAQTARAVPQSSWVDAWGRRPKRKAKGMTLGEARVELEAERTRVREARILGILSPSDDHFPDLAGRYLAFQRRRLGSRGDVAFGNTRGLRRTPHLA